MSVSKAGYRPVAVSTPKPEQGTALPPSAALPQSGGQANTALPNAVFERGTNARMDAYRKLLGSEMAGTPNALVSSSGGPVFKAGSLTSASAFQALKLGGATEIQQAQQGGQVNPAIFPYPPAAATPAEALQRLEQIRDFWTAQPAPNNRVGVFATAYIEMTEALTQQAAQYRAAGNNAQAEAIEAMITPFANEYFEAFAAFQATTNPLNQPVPPGTPTDVPQVWQVHFEVAMNPDMPMASVLATAMNAHILYDLPRVIGDLSASGHPAYQLGSDAEYARNEQAFLEYGNAFAQAGSSITQALTERFGVNDVTLAYGTAAYFNVAEPGTDVAVGLMRGTAFDVARMLVFNEGFEVNFTAEDLDRVVANFSRGFAGDINHAVDNLDPWTRGDPLAGGATVLAGMNAGISAVLTLDYLVGLPDFPFQPVATPPTQPVGTVTPGIQ